MPKLLDLARQMISGEVPPPPVARLVGFKLESIERGELSPDSINAFERDGWEVYVSTVPPTTERWRVSTAGGVQPRWSGAGTELYYLAPDGTMMVSGVKAGASL